MSNINQNQNILVILSGSIACFKAATLISSLKKQGAQVKVVATKSALRFIGIATLEGLSGNKCYHDNFESGHMMAHIELARWADKVVVYPASANLIAQWAQGRAEDLAGCIHLALESSKFSAVFVAPAMNQAMWAHPATQKNVRTLKQRGYQIMGPAVGLQACGESGSGRLLEPELAFDDLISPGKESSPRVLITFGGTQEKLDDVRVLSNTSTGSTGAFLAEGLRAKGFDVHALVAQNVSKQITVSHELFSDFESLNDALQKHLAEESWDSVIHLAAVSDFSLHSVQSAGGIESQKGGKLPSDQELILRLTPNFKILNRLKSYAKKSAPQVIGFKLTSGITDPACVNEKVTKIFQGGGVDYVVHNDLSQVTESRHEFSIFKNLQKISSGQSKQDLLEGLVAIMTAKTAKNTVDNKEMNHVTGP